MPGLRAVEAAAQDGHALVAHRRALPHRRPRRQGPAHRRDRGSWVSNPFGVSGIDIKSVRIANTNTNGMQLQRMYQENPWLGAYSPYA